MKLRINMIIEGNKSKKQFRISETKMINGKVKYILQDLSHTDYKGNYITKELSEGTIKKNYRIIEG